MITIKRAGVTDAKHISHLGKLTFEESYGAFFENQNNLNSYLDTSFSIPKIISSLHKPENLYWLVHDSEQSSPIGYAKLKLKSPTIAITDQNVCKLQRIYLKSGYEGQGIGTKLHEVILQEAIRQDFNHLWLSNLKIKEQAVSFYKKLGYQITGEHPFTIGKQEFDFWIMSKKLK